MGLTEVGVVDAPIDVPGWLARGLTPAHGAQAMFVGVVRNENVGRQVNAVSYDAFEPLLLQTFRELCEEARAKWGEAISCVVVHRRGRLAVGEASVLVAACAPHRAESFEACRYLIEQLKVRAPVWKQEHYVDGDSEWLKGHELCRHEDGGHGHG